VTRTSRNSSQYRAALDRSDNATQNAHFSVVGVSSHLCNRKIPRSSSSPHSDATLYYRKKHVTFAVLSLDASINLHDSRLDRADDRRAKRSQLQGPWTPPPTKGARAMDRPRTKCSRFSALQHQIQAFTFSRQGQVSEVCDRLRSWREVLIPWTPARSVATRRTQEIIYQEGLTNERRTESRSHLN
jgi:hypothetical protein